jgi:hypothetical protein
MHGDNGNRNEFILTNGNHPGAVERAFEWLVSEWESPENRDTVIAVPSKRNLDNIEDTLKNLIGEPTFRGIRSSENHSSLEKGIHLHTMTKRIQPSSWDGGPVLALFCDDELLDDIDGLNGTTSVLAVPWIRQDIEKWEKRWSLKEIEFTPEK